MVGLALALLLLAPAARQEPQPRIALVILDDVGVPDFQAAPTPNFDALASAGMTFTRAYASPVCAATRRSLLFGLEQAVHFTAQCVTGSPHPGPPEDDPADVDSLADVLGAGWAAGFYGKWHAGNAEGSPWQISPTAHGFADAVWALPSPAFCGGTGYGSWVSIEAGQEVTRIAQPGVFHSTAAQSWLSGALSCPRLAVLAFQESHSPYDAPAPYALPQGFPAPTTDRERFLAMIASSDFQACRLIEVLDLTRDWVIVIGDNGSPGEVTDPPTIKAKRTAFELGVRVPMIVAGPGVPRGTSTDRLVGTADLYATLAAITGGSHSSPNSVDLSPILADPNAPEVRTHVYVGHVRQNWREEAVIRHDGYKLRRHNRANPTPQLKLYDLNADPDEVAPLDLGDPVNLAVAADLLQKMPSPPPDPQVP